MINPYKLCKLIMYTTKTFTPDNQMMKLLVLVSQSHYQSRATSFTGNDGGKK
jgi:hypothetical protein